MKWAWLLLVVAVVTGGVARGDDIAMKELQDLTAQINDLDSMLEQEESVEPEALSPEGQAIQGVCEALVQVRPVPFDDDFSDVMTQTLTFWNRCLQLWNSKVALANWKYSTDLSEANAKKLEAVQTQESSWRLSLARAAQHYKNDVRFDDGTLDDDMRRQIRLVAFTTEPEDPGDVKKLIQVQSRLEETYSTARVLGLSLEPDLQNVMREAREPEAMLAAWWGWRNATGPQMVDDYEQMVDLMNQGAKDNGFPSYAEAWMASQFDETDDLEALVDGLWAELEPLYLQLHAYVRHKLQGVYTGGAERGGARPDDRGDFFQKQLNHIFESGGIPAHLTGNMWAQNWQNIYALVKPYDLPEVNYDAKIKDGYDVKRLFRTAEQFYSSLGLYNMTDKFWQYSMLQRPDDDTEVVCHASASDMFTEDDFRIKMCTELNMDYFETIHHEMGHVQYFMAYSGQPTTYRDGANSAFHEAIGDTASLSALSRTHLHMIGLDGGDKEETRGGTDVKGKRAINYLMEKALFKVAFLPFGLMIDKWRWDVLRGNVNKQDYNRHWWDLRLKYQGIIAPVPRSSSDFDPGAKYHIPSNSPYICYFVSFIIQFQFYEAMCDISGHQGELYDCDFFTSKQAGAKLLEMLQLGKSVPWPDAMEVLTGTRDISTKSILTYFQPLYDWLRKVNMKNGVKVGWEDAKINWQD